MTEAEWLSATDPKPMLEFLSDTAAPRKLRLFAGACCSRIWRLLSDQRSTTAIEVLERFLDGRASEALLQKAYICAEFALEDVRADPNEQRWWYAEESAARAVCEACIGDLVLRARQAVADCACDAVVFAEERDDGHLRRRVRNAQAACLRDMFGNPFRPVVLNPACRAHQVRALAHAAYDERIMLVGILEPARLAVLADALEHAGSSDAGVLEHLRGPGPHARGCHFLDALLDKK